VDADVGDGLASEDYATALAELLVVRDETGRVVGSVALVLSGEFGEVTASDEEAAHRLYERLGFTRLPQRDWSPVPGIDLLVYATEL
jgi:hypothetical protein